MSSLHTEPQPPQHLLSYSLWGKHTHTYTHTLIQSSITYANAVLFTHKTVNTVCFQEQEISSRSLSFSARAPGRRTDDRGGKRSEELTGEGGEGEATGRGESRGKKS